MKSRYFEILLSERHPKLYLYKKSFHVKTKKIYYFKYALLFYINVSQTLINSQIFVKVLKKTTSKKSIVEKFIEFQQINTKFFKKPKIKLIYYILTK